MPHVAHTVLPAGVRGRGIAQGLVWNRLLETPAGVEGSAIGVFCSLAAFAVANKTSPTAPGPKPKSNRK